MAPSSGPLLAAPKCQRTLEPPCVPSVGGGGEGNQGPQWGSHIAKAWQFMRTEYMGASRPNQGADVSPRLTAGEDLGWDSCPKSQHLGRGGKGSTVSSQLAWVCVSSPRLAGPIKRNSWDCHALFTGLCCQGLLKPTQAYNWPAERSSASHGG